MSFPTFWSLKVLKTNCFFGEKPKQIFLFDNLLIEIVFSLEKTGIHEWNCLKNGFCAMLEIFTHVFVVFVHDSLKEL